MLCGIFIAGSVSAQNNGDTFVSNAKHVDVSTFDASVEKMIDGASIPAISIAVIENNEVVYSNSYGVLEAGKSKEVNDKTIFEGASLTKVFLTYVAHKLAESGQLDLDKAMYQYLEHPELNYDERYKLITPRMVLSHTSGIENWKEFNQEDTLEILADPGTEFIYSGEGYQYLAEVIETILGKPYDEYIYEIAIDPFDLKRTYMSYGKVSFGFGKKKARRNYAIGTDDYGNSYEKWKNKETVPASGVHCNAQSIATLLTEMFNGENLTKETINEMLSAQMELPFIETTDDMAFSCGLGFLQLQGEQDSIIAFSGINPGYRSEIFYSTKEKRGFVFLTNSDRGAVIISELNRMTAQLDLSAIFADSPFIQYPSEFVALQNEYLTLDEDTYFNKVKECLEKNSIDQQQLEILADWVSMQDEEFGTKIYKLMDTDKN